MVKKSIILYALLLPSGILFAMNDTGTESSSAPIAAMEHASTSDAENCAICLAAIDTTLPSYHPLSQVTCQRIFGCPHSFHAQCLANWIEDIVIEKGLDKVTCPVCRNRLIQPITTPCNPHLEVALYAPQEYGEEHIRYMKETSRFTAMLSGCYLCPEMKEKQHAIVRNIMELALQAPEKRKSFLDVALHQEHINVDLLEWILVYCADRGIHPRAHICADDECIRRALSRAFRKDYTSKTTSWLLAHGAGIGTGSAALLKHCYKRRNIDEALTLINYGAQPIANTWFLRELLKYASQAADNTKYLVHAEQLIKAETDINQLFQEELRTYPNQLLYSPFFSTWLINHGTGIHIEETSPNLALLLIWAIHEQPIFAEWLIAHGANSTRVLTYILQQAPIESGHPLALEQPVVQWLIQHGARPTIISHWLLQESLLSAPINTKLLQQQLDLGPVQSIQDGTLLGEVLALSRLDAAQWLYDHGAQPAVQRLLAHFSRTGPIEAVQFLVKHGADIRTYCEEMIKASAATPQIADYLCKVSSGQTQLTYH